MDEGTERVTASQPTTGTALACAPRSGSSLTAPRTDLTPCDRPAFAKALTPALALVGGTGMTETARREWLNAAYLALNGVPADLIERGAKAAMLKADHPSKIVPAVMAEIEQALAWRRIIERQTRPEPAQLPPPPSPEEEEERAEVAKLMRGLARKLEARAA